MILLPAYFPDFRDTCLKIIFSLSKSIPTTGLSLTAYSSIAASCNETRDLIMRFNVEILFEYGQSEVEKPLIKICAGSHRKKKFKKKEDKKSFAPIFIIIPFPP